MILDVIREALCRVVGRKPRPSPCDEIREASRQAREQSQENCRAQERVARDLETFSRKCVRDLVTQDAEA